MNEPRPNRPRRSVLIALIMVSLILVTLDVRGNGAIDSGRDAIRDVFAPVQRSVGGLFSSVGDWGSSVINAGDLRKENKKLKRDLAEAQAEAARGEAAKRENENLSDLLELPFVEDIPSVAAHVVSGSPSDFSWTVEIDRGTSDGVQTGMPVVAGDGLVGRVLDASSRRATVLLITDPSSGVGARLEVSGADGIIRGRAGRDTVRLDFIASETKVRDGEVVVTSGLQGARFPAGIPIGEVLSAEKDPGALQQKIIVEPLADLNQLEVVKVLRWPQEDS